MRKKQKLLVTGIAALLSVLCIVGLIWWAESSWETAREKLEASTASSSSSSESSSSSTSKTVQSTDTETSSIASSTASTANSNSGSQSGSNANNPSNGVATDTASATKSTGQDGKIAAQVLLSWWDAGDEGISANGSVNNVIENGGTCSLTASKGTTVKSVSKQSIANATTTACGEMTIPISQLSSGDWVIELKYTSNTASGSSATQNVHIS
ncbi:hypothetical protein [Bifidobacterium psychraerophilum]|uniref:hypothetical protein n=1 Tax=Bifidobacterium psychraerophilum TaxID=218140 RepID=UPI0012E08689|nr:hypothetical protein [Bifidobacterium psychraerophilum]